MSFKVRQHLHPLSLYLIYLHHFGTVLNTLKLNFVEPCWHPFFYTGSSLLFIPAEHGAYHFWKLRAMTDFLCAYRFSESWRVNASWKLFHCPVSSFQLGLKLKNPEGGDISGYTTNGEWALIGTVVKTLLLRCNTNYYYYVSQPTFNFISNSGCPLNNLHPRKHFFINFCRQARLCKMT